MLKRMLASMLVFILFSCALNVASAGIKVSSGDSPVYVTTHSMGYQVIQNPNGMYTFNWLISGFTADKFPANVNFKTITNFTSTAKFQPALASMVITDATGKITLGRYEFNPNFIRPGSEQMQIVDWRIVFPREGYYAMNMFIDGKLVGYFPFNVWAK